ncbi:MAG: hypothetical protein FJ404_06675 [Verrucomicrobia bacterium]|nr:hypothetical protein [Verrucomicrobiota bacterium]
MAEGDISLKTTAGSRGCAAFLWLGTAWFLLSSMCDSEGSAASPTQSRVAVTALVFSPDGSRLVSSGARELEIWRTASLEKVGAVSCDLSKFGSLRFAPNGRVLVVAGGDPGRQGTVRVLRWPEREWISETGEHGDVVHRAECDGTGTSWVTASADGRLGLWKMSAEGKLSSSSLWTAHKGPVFSAVFLGEGRWILSAGADRSLKVWRSEDGMLVRSLNYHTEPIQSLELMDPGDSGRAGGALCVTAGQDRTLRVWQPEIGRMVRIVRGHEGSILAVASPKGSESLFTGGSEGVLRRIEAGSDRIMGTWKIHDDWIFALTASPDGKWLASGDASGRIRLHEIEKLP